MSALSNKQNSLRFKITLGFGTTALVLIIALLMTLYQVNIMRKTLLKVINIEVPVLKLSNQLIQQINETQDFERNWLINDNRRILSEGSPLWQQDIQYTVNKMKALLERTGYADSELTQIETNLTLLKTKQHHLETDTVLSNDALKNLFLSDTAPFAQSLRLEIYGYQQTRHNQLMAHLEQIRITLITLFFVCLSFLLLGIILCGLMGLILSRSITHPIQQLVLAAKRLATGNLSENVTIVGALEFEMLSESLNLVINTFRTIATVTEKMAMGDYSQRLDIRGDHDLLAISINQMLDNFSQIVNQANAIAEGNYSTHIIPRSQVDKLGTALQYMTETLRENQLFWHTQNWLKDGLTNFANVVSETRDLQTLCVQIISEIARYTEAGCATFHLYIPDTETLQLYASYAFVERPGLHNQFKLGEGIIGQVGLEKKPLLLGKTPEIMIISGTQEIRAETIYCTPILYEKNLVGVIELVWHHQIKDVILQYIKNIEPMLASHIKAAFQQDMTEHLLQEQKLLTEKLQTQQETLTTRNIELAEQAAILKESEDNLRKKDETQRAINLKLEEKTAELTAQKEHIEETNHALEQASQELQKKAEELSLASQYKSEFLANMSHELRTPLNSLIILAKLLSENKAGNLTADQVESAKIMLKSGNDLLMLINDVLDLAKVEAGKIEMHLHETRLADFISNTLIYFKHVTEDKKIDLYTELSPLLPEYIVTDEQRVFQIIRNLMSNAIKFTEKGSVKLVIEPAHPEDLTLANPEQTYVAFRVKDSGIGISKDKQALIFEAFQQVDGSTSRQYGGTGLGLSISTEFSKLLCGILTVKSEPGQGSEFSLIIPDNKMVKNISSKKTWVSLHPQTLDNMPSGEAQVIERPTLLIISNEAEQVALFKRLTAQEYDIIEAFTEEELLTEAKQHIISGILIDLDLTSLDAFQLMSTLKQDEETASIPLMLFGSLESSPDMITRGAIGYIKKPFQPSTLSEALFQIEEETHTAIRSLLIVEDDLNQLNAIRKLLTSTRATIETAATGTEALYKLMNASFDCVILDLGLPDISGQEIITQYKKGRKDHHPAIIIYTGRDLSKEDSESLKPYVDSIIFKGNMASMDKLKEETHAFLRRLNHVAKSTTFSKKTVPTIESKTETAPAFDHQTILVVDDDMRNVYALSQILKSVNLTVLVASQGKAAIEMLSIHPEVSLILMDIMMPVMDGYEAIQSIRKEAQHTDLPIIALTAKVMSGDKEKALASGANDFLSKPINLDELYRVLNKWLSLSKGNS